MNTQFIHLLMEIHDSLAMQFVCYSFACSCYIYFSLVYSKQAKNINTHAGRTTTVTKKNCE